MPSHNPRLIDEATMADETRGLLECRLAMLGVDQIEDDDRGAFDEIMQRCLSCSDRKTCAEDFKHDHSNPVWESYCPNLGALISLAE